MVESVEDTQWRKRYERERTARLEAEAVAERATRDLYETIEELKKRNKELERLHEHLLHKKDQTIAAQTASIRDLSTPVLGIWDEILILPLIGTVDTRRAQQTTQNLLDSIAKTQASVAIIDVTGVPVVDTMVADHLLNSVAAARMLGAEVILTGINPHNALTLVKLGVELGRIVTKGSLRAGLNLALEMTKHRLIKTG